MGTETVWLPTFFRISSFVFHRRNSGSEQREGEYTRTEFSFLGELSLSCVTFWLNWCVILQFVCYCIILFASQKPALNKRYSILVSCKTIVCTTFINFYHQILLFYSKWLVIKLLNVNVWTYLGGEAFINLFAHKLSDHKFLEISGSNNFFLNDFFMYKAWQCSICEQIIIYDNNIWILLYESVLICEWIESVWMTDVFVGVIEIYTIINEC